MLQQLPVTFGFKVPSSYAKPLMVLNSCLPLTTGRSSAAASLKVDNFSRKTGMQHLSIRAQSKDTGHLEPGGWGELSSRLIQIFKPVCASHSSLFALLKVITALISQSFLYCFFFLNCLYYYLLMLLIVLLMRQRGLFLASKNVRRAHVYVTGNTFKSGSARQSTTQTWAANGWMRTEGCGHNFRLCWSWRLCPGPMKTECLFIMSIDAISIST